MKRNWRIHKKYVDPLLHKKNLIETTRESIYYRYDDTKYHKEFEVIVDKLISKYNADLYLNKLSETKYNLYLLPQSYLSEQYGTGPIYCTFLGPIEEVTTKIKSKETGKYELLKCTIAFRFAHPTMENVIDVAYDDCFEDPFLD